MRNRGPFPIFVALALVLSCSPAADPEVEERGAEEASEATEAAPTPAAREACAERYPLRNAYFGDLHVHTTRSMDANIFGNETTPRQAYRFARGEAIPFTLGGDGATHPVKLERPLDFAAVTDHASQLGEVGLCTTPGSPTHDSMGCRVYRGEVEVPLPEGLELGGNAVTAAIGARMAALGGSVLEGEGSRSPEVCGADYSICRGAARTVWAEAQSAAAEAYDQSAACRFTSFVAYEYTATPELAKVHRNVIFRNETVPALPISYVDEPDAYAMWEDLRTQCLDAGTGCDVLTIPHNPNLSNGRMFQTDDPALPLDQRQRRARLRERIEPLVEMMQIKGDSECRNGLAGVLGGRDELCDFERYRAPAVEWEDCGAGQGAGALTGQGCITRRDYARYALAEGLREEQQLGVNPFKLGFIASTDAHNSNPGDVQERSYDGWSGLVDSTPGKRLQGGIATLSPMAANPGGLVGVWAEENSRDALFDAMKRRETFGTSGPRIKPRFFGGWGYDPGLCEAPDMLDRAYAGGVAMGGDLPAAPVGAVAPSFLVSALRDPGTASFPGGKLQRIQVIKTWPGDEGEVEQRVYEVAGTPDNGTSVEEDTCRPVGEGHDSLCAVWSDPDFDASQGAVYYARAVENPSCRWSTWQCNALPEDERPPACSDESIPKTIQERAWTSPIWYSAGP
jgi:hypothetical protein